MTLLTTETPAPRFLTRFDHVWASLRRFQVSRGLAQSALAATLGLLALAAADFRLELPWMTRAAGLAVAAVVVLAVVVARVIVPARWWTKRRTASEIERKFPMLGQRIRTVVQYAGLSEDGIHHEGVTPSLVEALEVETEDQAAPLSLGAVVPWNHVWVMAALASVPALALLIASARDAEWRVAVERALLGDRPYTTLTVTPGDVTVEQGESVAVAVALKGRERPEVVLQTRPEGKPEATWTAFDLSEGRKGTIEKVKDPVSYRFVAGPATSRPSTIQVRYPLTLKEIEVALTPPAYTGVKSSTVKGGDVSAIEGTGAEFQVRFDSHPAEASLVVTDPSVNAQAKNAPAPRVIPLKDEGSAFTTTMTLTKSLSYRVEAKTDDGRVLPKNRYRIDVHEDRAPRVAFEEPDEALEVHPVAEVRHRVRAGDDFGLSRFGIVFRFNDGEEQTLVASDFPETSKRPTSSSAEETLLLEKLAASPTDSVTYYGFAEDNYPGGAHRTETDLRYIDIRPFKREYKKGEKGDDAGEGGDRLASLEELIARQRFNLNRGVRLARRKPGDKGVSDDPLKIAGFEETLATLTREFTEGVEGIANQRVEPLHQAEEAMLAAVAAIDQGKNADAPRHMGSALRHLVESRRRLVEVIGDDPAQAQALRRFDRTQAQKIRKPKSETEEAQELAEKLEELAKDEDFVYATIETEGTPGGTKGKAEAGEKGETEPNDPADPKEAKPSKSAEDKKAKGEEKDGDKGEPAEPKKGEAKEGGKGEGEDGDEGGGAEPKKADPRETKERQEKIADTARELEERLKKLDAASDLAKARMAKAAETAEKVSGDLARGNTKEAAKDAKAGAALLHELARQVKGEITREVAEELAMARDLAADLAQREAELADMPDAQGDQKGDGEGKEPGKGKGKTRSGGKGGLSEAEQLDRLREEARTLAEWLKGIGRRAEGEMSDEVREVVQEGPAEKVVERTDRVGELILGGRKPEAKAEAKELSRTLEVLARRLDVLHRGIVAPEIARVVDAEKRVAELTDRLKTLKTDAEITEWHRAAASLVRELEKAGLGGSAEALTKVMDAGGWHDGGAVWNWGRGPNSVRIVPDAYVTVLGEVTLALQARLQDMILKDVLSARDEATPPEFKELVERYYEVLSKDGGSR